MRLSVLGGTSPSEDAAIVASYRNGQMGACSRARGRSTSCFRISTGCAALPKTKSVRSKACRTSRDRAVARGRPRELGNR